MSKDQDNVIRVFFSSPFGGMELEREELTKKYWPQLSHMCATSGYTFIPVDLRWGITSEMSSKAITIQVCMQELDRSHMIVGFFGQRYGWHGSSDTLLQKSFDVAAAKYPWLNNYRERAVTELEFLHGHLNKPGGKAACFFFRDEKYDEKMYLKFDAEKNQRESRKFAASTDGPNARTLLDNLKERIWETNDKCLAVHMKYPTPEEGARLMFETIHKHLKDVLLAKPLVELTEREQALVDHDRYCKRHLTMGGLFVGGDEHIKFLDDYVLNPERQNPVVVLGPAGSGKSALLSNWLKRYREDHPNDIVAYHFIGCNSISTGEVNILNRLNQELQYGLEKKTGEGSKPLKSQDIPQLIKELEDLLKKLSPKVLRVILVVDGLDKEGGSKKKKAARELYWLPKKFPEKVKLIVSCCSDNNNNKIDEMVTERGFQTITMSPLTDENQDKLMKAMLELRGKSFSKEQSERINSKKQTENPLYLKILLEELLGFGEFFQFDSYLGSLLEASDTKTLLLKFLQRMEEDYNEDPQDNVIKKIMCCLLVSRQGLSEQEIKSIVKISDQFWSTVYFAMDKFLEEKSAGVYGFAYEELSQAVREQYCKDENTEKEFSSLVAKYFYEKLMFLNPKFDSVVPERIVMELPWLLMRANEKEKLEKCLSFLPLLWTSCFDRKHNIYMSWCDRVYDFIEYLDSLEKSKSDIVSMYLKTIDEQVALIYNDSIESGHLDKRNISNKLLMVPFTIAKLLDEAGYKTAIEPLYLRALRFYNAANDKPDVKTAKYNESTDFYVQLMNTIAIMYVDTERFEEAEKIHQEVLALRTKFGKTSKEQMILVGVSLNGLGILYNLIEQFDKAEEYLKKVVKHYKKHLQNPVNTLTAGSLTNLGQFYFVSKQFEEALKFTKEGIEMYDEIYFGSIPPDVVGAYQNLAIIYRNLGRIDEAEPLYQKTLDILVNSVGENHWQVGEALMNFGTFKMQIREYEKAEEMYKRSFRLLEDSYGPDYRMVILAQENVALSLIGQGKHQEADSYFIKANTKLHEQGRLNLTSLHLNQEMIRYYMNTPEKRHLARETLERLAEADLLSYDGLYRALHVLYMEIPPEQRYKQHEKHTLDYGLKKFPSSVAIIGGKLDELAPVGDAKSLLVCLQGGEFEAEIYNTCYSTLVEHGHREEGMKILQAAAEKFPQDSIILSNLAAAHAFYKDYDKGLTVLDRLLEAHPDDISAIMMSGRLFALSGNLNEATKRMIQAKETTERETEPDSEVLQKINDMMKILEEAQAEANHEKQ